MNTETHQEQVIALTGASGFVGRHLLSKFLGRGDCRIRVLVHKNQEGFDLDRIKIVEGSLLERESLLEFLVPDCTVINLAFLAKSSRQDNVRAMDNLLEAGVRAGVRRLIHVSTATVVGRTRENRVDEETECMPGDAYETLKLDLEKMVLDKEDVKFSRIILRPTAVFGPGGRNLMKLAADIQQGRTLNSYLKQCLFNDRKMNLVAVDNVVAAIEFLAGLDKSVSREVFIVSDDEDLENNYRDIESFLRLKWGMKGYALPIMPLPRSVLSYFLQFKGRSNRNPARIYVSDKLMSFGFKKPIAFATALDSFAKWYRETEGVGF